MQAVDDAEFANAIAVEALQVLFERFADQRCLHDHVHAGADFLFKARMQRSYQRRDPIRHLDCVNGLAHLFREQLFKGIGFNFFLLERRETLANISH